MNNNYITAEDFICKNGKIQVALTEWWIEYFDNSTDWLIPFNWNGEDYVYRNILNMNCSFLVEDCIPLFTETQLRLFIEESTNNKVSISAEENELYYLKADTGSHSFNSLSDDLLQAYWQVACQIANK